MSEVFISINKNKFILKEVSNYIIKILMLIIPLSKLINLIFIHRSLKIEKAQLQKLYNKSFKFIVIFITILRHVLVKNCI